LTSQITNNYYKREFWATENLKYSVPHFRLEKVARVLNNIAGTTKCSLLDVGCGPATLRSLLAQNVDYYGIDIAIQQPDSHLIEADFVESPIVIENKTFDFVVAQGVFEYIGAAQEQKLIEIRDILKQHGKFILTYVNFDHSHKSIYWPYNNIRSFANFYASITEVFEVERCFPTSHRRYHDEPQSRLMKALQSHINLNIPFISRHFAVEYLFVCSKRRED
jgi:SAM-dependent methyltransferase